MKSNNRAPDFLLLCQPRVTNVFAKTVRADRRGDGLGGFDGGSIWKAHSLWFVNAKSLRASRLKEEKMAAPLRKPKERLGVKCPRNKVVSAHILPVEFEGLFWLSCMVEAGECYINGVC